MSNRKLICLGLLASVAAFAISAGITYIVYLCTKA